QEPRIALHRAAHVADQHERPPPHTRTAVEECHQLPTRPDRVAGGAAKVDASVARWSQAACPALGDPPGRLFQQPPHLLGLGPRHLFEILLPEQLLGAVTTRACGEFAVLAVAVELRVVETEG